MPLPLPSTLPALSDAALIGYLQEDAPYGDLTTRSLGLGAEPGRVSLCARYAMTVCASEEAARIFELCGAFAEVHAPSGTAVPAGAELLSAHGPAPALLLAWKVAQTLMEATSGIASEVARMVGALREAGMRQPVACTRKTLAGTRVLAVKAVQAGGGVMHRLGLSDSLLLFPEHRVFLDQKLGDAVARVRAAQPEKKLVAEATSIEEALDLAEAGVEVLQLERFSPAAVRGCREALVARGRRPLIAAAGGVTADNVVAYAEAGADVLVSSAPYQAGPKDVAVRFFRG
jgi:molybdenum transport protein